MRLILAVLASLIFGPSAAAQTDPRIVDEVLRSLKHSTDLTSNSEAFLIGPGVALEGVTRPRASEAPGVCEQDQFYLGLTRMSEPGAPPALEVTAERQFHLRAIEDEPDDFGAAQLLALDDACLQTSNAYFFPVRSLGSTEPYQLVWWAGQAIQQLSFDGAQATVEWSCADSGRCISRDASQELLRAESMLGVSEDTGCFVNALCLRIKLDADGSQGHWIALVQIEDRRVSGVRWVWNPELEIVD